MLILIDGYNLIGTVAPPGRSGDARQGRAGASSWGGTGWLELARRRLIHEVASGVGPALAQQTCIVFDSKRLASRTAAAEDSTAKAVIQGITIEFSIGYDEADDRIEELIAAHHTPKRLTVVSSDHRIQIAARRRGALAVDGDRWLDRLAEGKPVLAIAVPTDHRPRSSAAAIEDDDPGQAPPSPWQQMDTTSWLRYFEVEDQVPEIPKPDPAPPKIVDNPFPPGYGEDLLDG